jgi:hypothetical protein
MTESLIASIATQLPASYTSATTASTPQDTVAATTAGDTVSFSAEALAQSATRQDADLKRTQAARSLLENISPVSNAALNSTVQMRNGIIDASQVQGTAKTSLITTATTQSGRTVALESYEYATPVTDENGASVAQSGYRVTISGNGDEADQSYILTDSTIINEDANGTLRIGTYASGQETSGDDIIIGTGLGGSALSGGDGNDTLIVLSPFGKSTISGGAGDDTVFVAGDLTGNVDTGTGDDTIVATTIGFGDAATIDTGEGDDIIAAVSIGFGGSVTINTGEGDDDIAASWIGVHGGQVNIDTGSGDDAIAASWIGVDNAQVNITTGSGDDTIDASWIGVDNAQVNIDTGSGDDGIYATWIGVNGGQVNISGGGGGSGSNSYGLALVNGDDGNDEPAVTAGMVDKGFGLSRNEQILDALLQNSDKSTDTSESDVRNGAAMGSAALRLALDAYKAAE